VTDGDLLALGQALADTTLVTGGSGIALGLPENFRRAGLLAPTSQADRLPRIAGAEAVISGSCSTATPAQGKALRETRPVFDVDPLRLAAGEDLAGAAAEWAAPHLGAGPVLISASAAPDAVARVQEQLGRERAGSLVEAALAEVARRLVERGV